MVRADVMIPRAKLKDRSWSWRARKPYGFIFKRSAWRRKTQRREAAQTLRCARAVHRVDAITVMRLVRGVSLRARPIMLNRIVAAGDDVTLANGFSAARNQATPVNQIAPSVLVSMWSCSGCLRIWRARRSWRRRFKVDEAMAVGKPGKARKKR